MTNISTNSANLLSHGKDVLQLEIDGLSALREQLDDSFIQAVSTILDCTGRLIITGMGKSGHIARKIAATLSSTGTPAMFVHPAEAGHGDLGMITRQDVILAISNSGESKELESILIYAKRAKIPPIAVTARPQSTLGKHGDILLKTPDAKEACPLELAPTTSTTIALALGDALAMVLMKARGFTPNEFGQFHPGGKLGAQLSRVGDLMHTGDAIPLAGEATPMSDTLLTISQKGFGVVGVLDDDGYLSGIVTDGDLRRNMAGLLDLTAGEVMTKSPGTIGTSALAQEAVNVMQSRKITCLFVVDPEGSTKVASIVPLAFPMIAGAGTMTSLISLRAEYALVNILIAIFLISIFFLAIICLLVFLSNFFHCCYFSFFLDATF